MNSSNLEVAFEEAKNTMLNGNMIGATNDVINIITNNTLERSDLECFENFLIEYYNYGIDTLDGMQQELENPENDDAEDRMSATQAHFERGLSAFETAKVTVLPDCVKELEASQMLIFVYKAIYRNQFPSGNVVSDKIELAQAVLDAFKTFFFKFFDLNTCSVFHGMQCYIHFCEMENMEENIKPLIDQKIQSYKQFRGMGSKIYRTHVHRLYLTCESHQESQWKTEALNDVMKALESPNQHDCILPILAYIDLAFEPVSLDIYRALRNAFRGVIQKQLTQLWTESDAMVELGCANIAAYTMDVEVTLQLKLENLRDFNNHHFDKMFIHLLFADVSQLNNEFLGGNAFQTVADHLLQASAYAKNCVSLTENIHDLLDAINEYIPAFNPNDYTLCAIHNELQQILPILDEKPVSESLQEIVNNLKDTWEFNILEQSTSGQEEETFQNGL